MVSREWVGVEIKVLRLRGKKAHIMVIHLHTHMHHMCTHTHTHTGLGRFGPGVIPGNFMPWRWLALSPLALL